MTAGDFISCALSNPANAALPSRLPSLALPNAMSQLAASSRRPGTARLGTLLIGGSRTTMFSISTTAICRGMRKTW